MIKDRTEHLKEHGGSFRNKTEGPLLDRNQRLRDVNHNRVIKNEFTGICIAAAIGAGTGFAISFIVNLAQNGLNPSSVRYAFASGTKAGLNSGALAAGSAIIGRTLGTMLSQRLSEAIINSHW